MKFIEARVRKIRHKMVDLDIKRDGDLGELVGLSAQEINVAMSGHIKQNQLLERVELYFQKKDAFQ